MASRGRAGEVALVDTDLVELIDQGVFQYPADRYTICARELHHTHVPLKDTHEPTVTETCATSVHPPCLEMTLPRRGQHAHPSHVHTNVA